MKIGSGKIEVVDEFVHQGNESPNIQMNWKIRGRGQD